MDQPGQAEGAGRVRRGARLSDDRCGVAYATCSHLPEGDDDFAEVAFALGGVGCEPVIWDDPSVDWSRFDLVVVRATWDYTGKVDAFLDWVSSLRRVANAADVIDWNHDKRYLQAMQIAGVPVVPTRWGPCDVADGRWVIKPRIGAGARGITVVDGATTVDADHVAQPYLDGIDERGETAMLYIDGQLSHCVAKQSRLGLDKTEESVAPRTPTADELEIAEAVMDTLPFDRGSLLYARIDLVPDRNGDPVLLEAELIEPSLFLAHADGAAERFAAAILGRL